MNLRGVLFLLGRLLIALSAALLIPAAVARLSRFRGDRFRHWIGARASVCYGGGVSFWPP